jgi:hypothetical protein
MGCIFSSVVPFVAGVMVGQELDGMPLIRPHLMTMAQKAILAVRHLIETMDRRDPDGGGRAD